MRVRVSQLELIAYSAIGIERKSRIDLGRHTSRDDLEDLETKVDGELVGSVGDLRVEVRAVLLAVRDGIVDQRLVLWQLRRLQQQRRVRGGI